MPRAVRQVSRFFTALSSALHEHHTLHLFAVGWAFNHVAFSRLGKFLKPDLIDHVRSFAISKFGQ